MIYLHTPELLGEFNEIIDMRVLRKPDSSTIISPYYHLIIRGLLSWVLWR